MNYKKELLIKRMIAFLIALVLALIPLEGITVKKVHAEELFRIYLPNGMTPEQEIKVTCISEESDENQLSSVSYAYESGSGKYYYLYEFSNVVTIDAEAMMTVKYEMFKFDSTLAAINSSLFTVTVNEDSGDNGNVEYTVKGKFSDWKSYSGSKTSPVKIVEREGTFNVEMLCENSNSSHQYGDSSYGDIKPAGGWEKSGTFKHESNKDTISLYKPLGKQKSPVYDRTNK